MGDPVRTSDLPSISLVTPSYNQAAFLEAAIRSVLEQDYPELEYIVLDGGSSDDSEQILRRYCDGIDFWRSSPDDGQAAAVNEGWRRARGEVLGWLNSDDLLEPGALEVVGRAFSDRDAVQVVFGNCRVIDADGCETGSKRPRGYDARTLLLGGSLPQPAVFLHRSVLERVGDLDDSLEHALDWEYFLRVFLETEPEDRRYVNRWLAASREYRGTKTRTGLDAKGAERRQVLVRLQESGDLETFSEADVRRAFGGTYWIQAVDEFLAGQVTSAVGSLVRAVIRDPRRLPRSVGSLSWLVVERWRRWRGARHENG